MSASDSSSPAGADAPPPAGAPTPTGSEEDPRRRLPAIGELLARPAIVALVEVYGRELVLVQLRERLARLRRSQERGALERELAELPDRLAQTLGETTGTPLARVINATGIFVHTNLGRSPLPRAVAAALPALLDASCNLEASLESGGRGDRNRRLERLLCVITGAEAAVVVNNNAAALLLVLAALARDREVLVSRGELVEIGGSFRVPEILEASGARLVEVGTTNRTRVDDYARAIGPGTALLLKVHPSNYRIVGFTETASEAALATLARARAVPLLVDEGSGLLRAHPAAQLADHPSHRELIAAGCDLVCGSGDKVLGGPQAGILVGRRDLVGRCRRHPMFRALRPGRSVVAALEGVLRLHLRGAELPLDRMWPDTEEHRRRLERVGGEIDAVVLEADAFLGGGAAPEQAIPGQALALAGGDQLLACLRTGSPPVVGYAREGRVILDLRTVDPADDDALVAAVTRARRAVAAGEPGSPAPGARG